LVRVVIFANGELPEREAALALLQEADFLIAADGGARHLLSMGLLPEVVIGDLDSLDEESLAGLISAGVAIERYPEDKDETDLELALTYALAKGSASILVIAALGNRLDQTLANLMLVTNPVLSGVDIRLDDGVEEVLFCRDRVEVHGQAGDSLSLIPWGRPVEGITTTGLQWSLQDETLFPDRSRGISNLMNADRVVIAIRSGLLLVIHRRRWNPP
jgi:thiamine pyrophosphokinase